MSAGEPTTQQLLAAYILARKLELFVFFWHGAAVYKKVLQYPVKLDNKGGVNAQWKMNIFASKSNSFFGISVKNKKESTRIEIISKSETQS